MERLSRTRPVSCQANNRESAAPSVGKETDNPYPNEYSVNDGVVEQQESVARQQVEASQDVYPDGSHSKNQSKGRKYIRWMQLVIVLIVILVLAITVPLVVTNTENNSRDQESGAHPLLLPPGSTVMSKELFDLAAELISISREVYNETPVIPGAIRLEDGIDAALFVKKDERCIVAFQATRKNLEDWSTNFPILDPVQFSSATGKTCKKRIFCFILQHSCKDQCDLVITGSSQGAALAAIAAVDLDDLRPFLVTFGQPATLFDVENDTSSCGDSIPRERYVRFVNTVEGTLNALPFFHSNAPVLQYDLVPMLPAGYNLTDKLGTLILLSDTNHFVVYSQGQRELVPPVLFGNFSSHAMVNYTQKFQAIQERHGQEAIHLDGFLDGSLCNYDSECQASSICYNRSCTAATSPVVTELSTKLGRGALCSRDMDCESNVCVVTCRDKDYRSICSASSPQFDYDECFSLLNLF